MLPRTTQLAHAAALPAGMLAISRPCSPPVHAAVTTASSEAMLPESQLWTRRMSRLRSIAPPLLSPRVSPAPLYSSPVPSPSLFPCPAAFDQTDAAAILLADAAAAAELPSRRPATRYGSHLQAYTHVLSLPTTPASSHTPRSVQSLESAADLGAYLVAALTSQRQARDFEIDTAGLATDMAIRVLASDDPYSDDYLTGDGSDTRRESLLGDRSAFTAGQQAGSLRAEAPVELDEHGNAMQPRKGRARMSQEKRKRLARRKEREALLMGLLPVKATSAPPHLTAFPGLGIANFPPLGAPLPPPSVATASAFQGRPVHHHHHHRDAAPRLPKPSTTRPYHGTSGCGDAAARYPAGRQEPHYQQQPSAFQPGAMGWPSAAPAWTEGAAHYGAASVGGSGSGPALVPSHRGGALASPTSSVPSLSPSASTCTEASAFSASSGTVSSLSSGAAPAMLEPRSPAWLLADPLGQLDSAPSTPRHGSFGSTQAQPFYQQAQHQQQQSAQHHARRPQQQTTPRFDVSQRSPFEVTYYRGREASETRAQTGAAPSGAAHQAQQQRPTRRSSPESNANLAQFDALPRVQVNPPTPASQVRNNERSRAARSTAWSGRQASSAPPSDMPELPTPPQYTASGASYEAAASRPLVQPAQHSQEPWGLLFQPQQHKTPLAQSGAWPYAPMSSPSAHGTGLTSGRGPLDWP
ncbi:hypothetical protein FA09DRAFT_339211 [Tilletiopsis washingtonensis]|uniref:Uncharacterized protein n=1 Tax=Tilletiopsis washingtonensis TaxID=58919 RepID=A0A316Z7H0_9BASI|nr:hypothetical protein FA09DRAFT_339211 [Tilletiopsis washingtonensis]PWN97727.1 hypothetical protein FA09DRAFT_339211 [Tilletiopsis washingtonensis]